MKHLFITVFFSFQAHSLNPTPPLLTLEGKTLRRKNTEFAGQKTKIEKNGAPHAIACLEIWGLNPAREGVHFKINVGSLTKFG
jgi:hypothetical protein